MIADGLRSDVLPPHEREAITKADEVAQVAHRATQRAAEVRSKFWKRMMAADRILEGRK